MKKLENTRAKNDYNFFSEIWDHIFFSLGKSGEKIIPWNAKKNKHC